MGTYLFFSSAAILAGFLIDCLIGDPYRLPHPVCGIGKWISFLEKKLRARFPKTKNGELMAGRWLVVLVTLVSTLIPLVISTLAYFIHPWVYFVVETVMCWQIFAAHSLRKESMKVCHALEKRDSEGARLALRNIVGRDTDVLDSDGMTRAAVETVAENTSDGVTAPMLYLFLLGAAGGFFYKSVNTMDSMVGYQNEKYQYFGRAAAKTDDVLNFLPSRITAVLMILSSAFCGLDIGGAVRIFRRDRRKHASPNSAQTESVCAGALGVRLAGDAVYGGVVCQKEYIGDAVRPIEPNDIRRANRLMYVTAVFLLTVTLALKFSAAFIAGFSFACL